MENSTHCENCGRENPDTSDGYTVCCNERVCYGTDHGDRYGTERFSVRACCWAMAEKKFKRLGEPIPVGASRLMERW